MLLTLFQLNLEGADVTAPTLSSATIASSGDTISFVFDESVTFGAGGNGGFAVTMSGGAATLTYSSGDGTDTLTYSISRTVAYNETGTLAYTQPGDGVEDSSGNDLVTFSGTSITNNSLDGAPVVGATTWHEYIYLYPGLTGALSDKKMQFLAAQGFSTGSLGDRLHNWLASTYTSGTVNDMLSQWESDNL